MFVGCFSRTKIGLMNKSKLQGSGTNYWDVCLDMVNKPKIKIALNMKENVIGFTLFIILKCKWWDLRVCISKSGSSQLKK